MQVFMLSFVASLLISAGLVILVAALPPTRRLISELPAGPIHTQWCVLAGMIFFFILGYAGYLAGFWDRHQSFVDLLVPVLFICSACFVWLAVRMSLATVSNVRRMSSYDRTHITDALTGLHSRHYLDTRMREEMIHAERRQLAVSVMLLDIDQFASINEDFGYHVGDRVLTRIARILSGSLRESDLLVRYGGEEIAVLAMHTPPAVALTIAERLRREIEVGARKALLEAQGARRAITVSIGVAGHGAGAPATRDLLEIAEKALAKAKNEGRNRVAFGSS